MYQPSFNSSKTGVPILSWGQIEEIGRNVVAEFCPDALKNPVEMDVDRLLTKGRGLEQDFQLLSHCRLYLGMTVFQDCTIPVFDPIKKRAENINVSAGTVILDSTLLEESQEHCYRFTAAHEAAHDILHREYFRQQAEVHTSDELVPVIQCLRDTIKPRSTRSLKSDKDWLEWQANSLASVILMPREITLYFARKAESRSRCCNAGLTAVSKMFNVSTHAAYYRLKQLGFPVD